MPTKIEEAFAHLGAILMQTAASDDKIIIGHVRDAHGLLQDVLRAPSPRAPSEDDDWKDDPSADERWQAGLDFGLLELCAVADERWQAGLDFGLLELCAVLDVKPHDVTWDAATETLDGDVSAVIGNILRAKYGEDFDPTSPAPTAAPTLGREADCDCGAATSGKWSGIHSEGCSAMRETTGIDDVEWLDAKVVELSEENARLRYELHVATNRNGIPSGLDNLRAIMADRPFMNSVLTVAQIQVILDNTGGFMPDEAVMWFRECDGKVGAALTAPDKGGPHDP